jgi:hypothetical protein
MDGILIKMRRDWRLLETTDRRAGLQPLDEFAADSLQITQKEIFDALADCTA